MYMTDLLASKDNVWEITDDGNYPVAASSLQDIAQYTTRAVILAHSEPGKVPSRLRIFSEVLYVLSFLPLASPPSTHLYFPGRTPNQYVQTIEKIKGEKQTINYIPYAELLATYKEVGQKNPFFVLRVAAQSPAADFSSNSHNELLNPGQKYFKRSSWEDYVKAVSF